jgi:hypothetical protein
LIEIGLLLLDKILNKFVMFFFSFTPLLLPSLGEHCFPFISTNLNPLFPKMIVKIGPVVLKRKIYRLTDDNERTKKLTCDKKLRPRLTNETD